jgi:hypothetical protein
VNRISILFLFTFFGFQEYISAQEALRCGTPDMDIESLVHSIDDMERWRANRSRDVYPVMIYVAWHCVYSSSNQGYLSQAHIEGSIGAMNYEYNQ